MKFIYPAVIRPEASGGYYAYFPNLTMCEAYGDSLEDVIERARDAANDWIALELSEDDPVLPPSFDPSDIPCAEGEFVRNILVNYRMMEGWDE